ncbi:serine/threonine protein phosphatase 1 [Tropicimonas isoalkanivorans]|uniref:Serine/threonine protein phosphatase 1 n=1 Tax=Tropicimonas isoalkanivorans TaxID=441112 RepID=A0A1I1KYQ7_9RHOB|nr:serine/threonine protein phosphatase 1 [Tropicimonas isoalkanivorans]
MSLFSRIFRPAHMIGLDLSRPADAMPRPERLTYAIGDIHGCFSKLERMLDEIGRDRAGRDADLVFLGDYIDRGGKSCPVLRHVHRMQQDDPDHVICLVGNHDRMMLQFLEAPVGVGQRWLQFGGEKTLTSFGVPDFGELSHGARSKAWAKALREAVGPELLDWLAARPLWWKSGSVVAVHALTDPARAMEVQKEQVLLWARPRPVAIPRRDGTWVVHGHTMVENPQVGGRHISIDTGAWRGGPLTAAVLGDGPIRFLSVR